MNKISELIDKISFKNLLFDAENGSFCGTFFQNILYPLCGDVWNVELKNNETVEAVSIMDCDNFSFDQKEELLLLKWKNTKIEVCVSVREQGKKTIWNISTNVVNDNWKINKIKFPIISNINCFENEENDILMIPYQNGWIVKNPTRDFISNIREDNIPFWMGRANNGFEADYPTTLNFQFTSYNWCNGTGCYLSTVDENAYTKSYRYFTDNEKKLSFEVINYPEGMGLITSYCMPYDFAIQFYVGDWQEAVNIYREWAVNQKWCRKKLRTKNLSNNLVKTDLWRINHTNYALGTRTEEFFDTCLKIKNYTDAELGIHWYGWNMGEHDVDYPYYIKESLYDEGWDKKLCEWNEKFDSENIVKIPYVNARLWDKWHPSWNAESAVKSSLKDEKGNTYCEPWKGDRLAPMCPATYHWQQKVASFGSNYINNLNFDGIYLDQIASFRATLCFDSNHSHPIGGGCWWNDRYHDLINKLRCQVDSEKFFTSESCCETYIDAIDMFLVLDNNLSPLEMFNYMTISKKSAESIPLFNMIYGKHSMLYGSICRASDELKIFEYKFMRNILWGFVPTIEGFEMKEISNPKSTQYFEIIKKGVDFYKDNKEKLIFGRVCRLPKVKCDELTLEWHWDEIHQRNYPGILAVEWENEACEKSYIIYNCFDVDKEAYIDRKKLLVPANSFVCIENN